VSRVILNQSGSPFKIKSVLKNGANLPFRESENSIFYSGTSSRGAGIGYLTSSKECASKAPEAELASLPVQAPSLLTGDEGTLYPSSVLPHFSSINGV
jgi:hypothetical protein